ncbi:helix-turn-helix transcriptional regulator [Allobaculum sp. JKK-2023]|uniref:helix-turn-helix domain-containing protein n=1 Tax=Allobaculum sp. JKK-2023 TaxID=3108943 RepID=UPI002B053FB6|nr:helix-turn-helix transcriptional regulator [Allobaculum sp. JKK-2023]
MATVKFNEYLNSKMQDDDFKEGFLKEKAILESSLAVYLARQNAGLSQRELAQLSKVPQSTIARIERGDNTRIDTISKIATALGKRLTITIQ